MFCACWRKDRARRAVQQPLDLHTGFLRWISHATWFECHKCRSVASILEYCIALPHPRPRLISISSCALPLLARRSNMWSQLHVAFGDRFHMLSIAFYGFFDCGISQCSISCNSVDYVFLSWWHLSCPCVCSRVVHVY